MDEEATKVKVADALRTLIVAYHKKQITGHDIADQLVHWAKNGLFGYTNEKEVNNLIGWEFIAGFAHELKFVAADFNNQYERGKEWADINGLIIFLKANDIKIGTARTIERLYEDLEKKKLLLQDEHYRFINGRDKEYHKTRYIELYRKYLKDQKTLEREKKQNKEN